jgi:hypothetical protein
MVKRSRAKTQEPRAKRTKGQKVQGHISKGKGPMARRPRVNIYGIKGPSAKGQGPLPKGKGSKGKDD